MAQQGVAGLCHRLSRQRCLPVQAHPFVHQRTVQRTGVAQHEINAGRLIEEIGAIHVAAQLRFEPPYQTRQQCKSQRVPIDGARGGGELRILRQPQIAPGGRLLAGIIDAMRQQLQLQYDAHGLRLIQHRHQAKKVGVGHRIERQGLRRLFITVQRGPAGIDLLLARTADLP